jgi:hypothetical protein
VSHITHRHLASTALRVSWCLILPTDILLQQPCRYPGVSYYLQTSCFNSPAGILVSHITHRHLASTALQVSWCLILPPDRLIQEPFPFSNSNLSSFQKRALCAGIKVFNTLPLNPKSLRNEKAQSKVASRRHLGYTLHFLLCR